MYVNALSFQLEAAIGAFCAHAMRSCPLRNTGSKEQGII